MGTRSLCVDTGMPAGDRKVSKTGSEAAVVILFFRLIICTLSGL